MAKEQSKVFPACGTRNKAKWECCAKCGESLQKVSAQDSAAAVSTAPSVSLPDDTEAEGSAWGMIAAIGLVIAGVVVGIWGMQRNKPAEVPVESSNFQLPTM